jgi:hypothetical protein
MKKKRIKQAGIHVVIPQNCQMFWVSHGFNFFVQALQLGIGGVAMCAPIALLCPSERGLIPLLLAVFALAPILCGLFCWIESLLRKWYDKPLVGIDSESIYLSDGMGMICRLNEITAIHYRFGHFRKRGKYAHLQVCLQTGKSMDIVLPSPSLILAMRKAIPSVKITVGWVSRFVIWLLIGLAVGGLVSLVFLMQ